MITAEPRPSADLPAVVWRMYVSADKAPRPGPAGVRGVDRRPAPGPVDPGGVMRWLRSRFRKCCDGLTVCTCRIGHRCKCEGCNCS